MKVRVRTLLPLALIALAVIFGLMFSSCEESSGGSAKKMKIDERLDRFFSDLQNNRDSIWKNFHPDSNTREAGKNSSVFDTEFPQEGYSYTVNSIGSTTNITVDSDTQYTGETMVFIMKEDGDKYWMILKIDISDDGSYDFE